MSVVKRGLSVVEVEAKCKSLPIVLVGVGRCDGAECGTFGRVHVIASVGERGGVFCAPCAEANAEVTF